MIEARVSDLSTSQAARLLDHLKISSTESVGGESPGLQTNNWRFVDLDLDQLTDVIDRATAERFDLRPDKTYKIESFCRFDGGPFIDAAYRGLLERTPDAAGREFFLQLLRAGTAKIDILGRVRCSAEGRHVGARVLGLIWRYRLIQLTRFTPFGRVLAFFLELISIRQHGARLRRLEFRQWELASNQAEKLSAFALTADRNFGRIDSLIDRNT
jgi:hypothetical protein